MARVLFYEDRIVNLMHLYENSSEYGISMKAFSKWSADQVFSHSKQITVVTAINKLRVRVMPANVPIGQKVDVSIILSKGALVKLVRVCTMVKHTLAHTHSPTL